jgi:hypothetical protein
MIGQTNSRYKMIKDHLILYSLFHAISVFHYQPILRGDIKMSGSIFYSFIFIVLSITSTFTFSQQVVPDSIFIREKYVKYEYQVPMRDSIKLFTVVYAPKDTNELHPILFTRTPYSVGPYGTDKYIRFLSNLTRQYMQRNYIMVYQDVRGRFMSEGTFVDVRPYIPSKKNNKDIDESSDAYDTIDWLIKNIHQNNGRVGFKGISYGGFYTTMASIDAHPALKATSPQAPVSEWMGGDDWFHNGAFLLPHAFDFLVQLGWSRPQPTMRDYRPFDHGTPDGYKFFLELGTLSNANKRYMHDSVAFWNELMRHGKWDKFWEERSVLPHLKNIKPATMVVGGWFDTENLYGALHTYAQIEKDNPANRNMLVMGPWAHHWWPRDDVDSLGDIKFGSNLSKFFAESLEVPFFEYYLRGQGELTLPKAVVFLTGANEWKMLDSWPPKNTEQLKIYFADKEKLTFEPPIKVVSEYDEYINDPKKPVPYTNEITHWYNAAFMVEDQRFASRRTDVLTYQTDKLTEEITVAGPITVDLVGSTSGTDCDWIVKVIDVFPDTTSDPEPNPQNIHYGGYQMLIRGDVLRAKFRNSLEKPEPVKPNQPTSFQFVLQDVFHKFKPDHCIMVQVQSTWFPMIDRNPGKFIDIYHAKDSDYQKTKQRIYHSTKHSSHLMVNVVRENKIIK